MGEKSQLKKKFIIETARKVFMEKGYKSVTMKDIVDACNISRGGLYLYYSDTEQLFLDVLQLEAEETDDIFSTAVSKKATAVDILALFMKEQKKELLRKTDTLSVATYEYAFGPEKNGAGSYLKMQFQEAVRIIERLIEAGISSGEFVCDDPRGAASNMMFAIEGLKICAQTMGITEGQVDREILFLMQRLSNDT